MKKIILVFALLLCIVATAQNYPGDKPELLLGKTLKVIPLKENFQKYGYRDFYKDEKLQKNYKKGSGYSTDYKALVGKEFKVTAIERYNFGYLPEPRYRLVLENAETGKLYFKYNEKSNSDFKFEVIGGLEFPEDHFCSAVKPYSGQRLRPQGKFYIKQDKTEGIGFLGYVDAELSSITFNINFNTGEKEFKTQDSKGITLVFDNGETITRENEEVKQNKSGSNVLNFNLIVKGETELKLVQEHKITALKVGKYNEDIADGFTIQEEIKCVFNKK